VCFITACAHVWTCVCFAATGLAGHNLSLHGTLCPSTGLLQKLNLLCGTRGTQYVPPRDFCNLVLCLSSTHLVYNMPQLRKDCPLCGKQGLLKLSNHLADYHHISIKDRKPYLKQAKKFPLDRNLKIARW